MSSLLLFFVFSFLTGTFGQSATLFSADVEIQDDGLIGLMRGRMFFDSARGMQRIDFQIGSGTYREIVNYNDGLFYLTCPSGCEAQSISYTIPSYVNSGGTPLSQNEAQQVGCDSGRRFTNNQQNARGVYELYSNSNGLPCYAVYGTAQGRSRPGRIIRFSNFGQIGNNRPVVDGSGSWITSSMPLLAGCPARDCAIRVDLSFVMDESGSISSSDFTREKTFIQRICQSYTISAQQARVNIAAFSFGSRLVLAIRNGISQGVVDNVLTQLRQQGGSTCIPCGIDQVRSDLQSSPRDVFNLMIIITDGENNVNSGTFTSQSYRNTVRSEFDLIISIGVGSDSLLDRMEPNLRAISSPPNPPTVPDTFYRASSFQNLLDNVIPQLVKVTCLDIPGNPCGEGCRGFCACKPPGSNVRSCICPSSCEDNNLCTQEQCNPNVNGAGCTYPPTDCSDGNLCTDDVCNPQTGCANPEIVCNDNNLCTNDTCDPAAGCRFPSNASACVDNNGCTFDRCDPGSGCFFVPYDPADCDRCSQFETVECPQLPCKENGQCDPSTGNCTYTDRNCEDGSNCTRNFCENDRCVAEPIDCNDNDPCTVDSCDIAEGCQNVRVNETVFCNDNSACTNDICVSGQGCVNEPVDCDDGNVCTVDSCNSVTGCVHTPKNCLSVVALKLGNCYLTTCNETREIPPNNITVEDGLAIEYFGEGCFIEQIANTTLDTCGCCTGFECSCGNVVAPSEDAAVLGGLALAAIILAVIGVAAVAGLLSGKKGYDVYLKYKGNMSGANTNPLYNADGMSGTNPMYAADDQ